MTISEQLESIAGSRFREEEPLSKHVNFRIGGPAKWFVEVRSVEELQAVLKVVREEEVEYVVFGGGSNMLVNDKGLNGIAIKIGMRSYEIRGDQVRAESGVLSSALARATANHGLKGLAWMITLPGTIGGAVRGNAGCFGGETKDKITSVEVLRDNKVQVLEKHQITFGYRDSMFKHNTDIILAASFKLAEGDVSDLRAELDDQLMKRKKAQPFDAGSAGCMFKNAAVTDDDLQRLGQKLDIPAEMSTRRQISVGWLIDQLDLKGKAIGDAQVSDVHGNFLVNKGSATADHIVQLIALIKTRARDEYGILLEEEVQYIGF
jgi:UDP-N-acetylmuramate dehydrogenase